MENGLFKWIKEFSPWPEIMGTLVGVVIAPLVAIGAFHSYIMRQVNSIFKDGENRAEKRAEEHKAALQQSEDRLLDRIKDLKTEAKEREDRLMVYIKDLKTEAKEREGRLLDTIQDLRAELRSTRGLNKSG